MFLRCRRDVDAGAVGLPIYKRGASWMKEMKEPEEGGSEATVRTRETKWSAGWESKKVSKGRIDRFPVDTSYQDRRQCTPHCPIILLFFLKKIIKLISNKIDFNCHSFLSIANRIVMVPLRNAYSAPYSSTEKVLILQ